MTAMRFVAVLCLVAGCSFVASTPLPRDYQPRVGIQPSCSQSNAAAGVDLILLTASVAVSISALSDANDPTIGAEDKQGALPAGILAGMVAALSGYSMVRGFEWSRTCRDAVEAAGLASHGSRDWILPPLILLTAGAVLLAVHRPATEEPDPDLCAAWAIRTALCRDNVYSCSLNRAGTCSHHHGVAQWL
jgi:uncharacterized protein DUF3761